MALSKHDQAIIREYLLGKLSGEEQQRIEERLMLEDELFEEFEISKGELIEEYRAGELPQKEQRWFEDNYLASPEGRQRHAFAIALTCFERPKPVLERPKPAPRVSWFERLFTALRTRPAAFATVGAAVVILAVASLMLLRPAPPQTSIAFALRNTTISRSSASMEYRKVSLTPGVGELRISLTLPQSGPLEANYRAELDNQRDTKSLQPAAHDANSVMVVIPAHELSPGLYSLRLFLIKSDGGEERIPGDYLFQITK